MSKTEAGSNGRGRGQPTKRGEIVIAAASAFADEGFGGTTVDSIVQRAKVSKRTFYQHFANKDEIFLELVRGWCNEILVPLQTPGCDSDDLRVMLRATANAYLKVMLSPAGRELFRIVIAEARRFPDLALQFYRAGHAPAAAALASRLRDAYGPDSYVAEQAVPLAEQFYVQVRGYLHERALLGIAKRPLRAEIDQCVNLAVDVFLGGIERRHLTQSPATKGLTHAD